ncbi:hypothetical protein BGZ75_002643 [Mortierella antarctica]|nr:hypothetical protein BGZ75_002643 [Mortierella antarctica]
MAAHSTNTSSYYRKRLPLLKLPFALGLLFLYTIALAADAQAPVGSRRMGFTQLDSILYIQGGFDTSTTGQFVALDLSKSWSASAPAWTTLRDGHSTSHLALASVSAAASGGRSTAGIIIAMGGINNPPFFNSYELSSGAWNNIAGLRPPYPTLEGHAAVSDPNTGLVYMIGGNSTNAFNQVSVYDPKSQAMVSQHSATVATSLTDVGAVWSTARNTILTFGGSRAPPADTKGLGGADLDEYDPTSKTWKTMSTSGDIPPARLDHCMVASEDGSTIVLFGGSDGNTYFDSIYILDVSSGKWKKGQSAPVTRTRMACGFHSHQFVAWGGSSGGSRTTMLNNLPIIYNLNDDKWTDEYSATEQPAKSSNTGTIVGVLVVIILIGVGAGLFIIRRRRRTREQAALQEDAAASAAAMAAEDRHSNIKVLASPDARHSHYLNAGAGGHYGAYGTNSNEYPLSKMEINDPYAVEAARARCDGYGSEPATYGGDSAGASPGGPGSEKTFSPATYYTNSTAAGATPSLQSPAVVYHTGMGSPYQPSPYLAYHQADGNPFISPDDSYVAALSVPGSSLLADSSTVPSPSNPFMTTSSSENEYHHPPPSTSPDPYRQYPTPAWNTTYQAMQSPSSGARAPQAMPEDTSGGYVPPPPLR